MTGIVVSLILLVIGYIQHRRKKTWVAPDVLFCYEWAFITFLASLHLFNMFEASIKVWMIVLIGSMSFIIGVNTKQNNNDRMIANKGCTISSLKPFFNPRTFVFFAVILFISQWGDFWQSIKLQALGYSLGEMRGAHFGSDEVNGISRSTGALDAIINMLKSAIQILVIAVGIYYYSIRKKRKTLYLLTVIGLVLMEAYTDGGRFGLAYLLVEVFVCFFLVQQRQTRISTGSSIRVIVVVVGIVAAIMAVSLSRGWEYQDFSVKYYRYICGNIVFFDQHLKRIDNSDALYIIWCSFYGLWAMLLPALRAFIGLPYPSSFQEASKQIVGVTQDAVQIGVNMYTNAFITPFYHLYADGRWVGVIVGMFLFGLLCGWVYRKVELRQDGRNIIVYLIICQMIFKSLSAYPFSNTGYVFIIIFFFLYKRKTLNLFR